MALGDVREGGERRKERMEEKVGGKWLEKVEEREGLGRRGDR